MEYDEVDENSLKSDPEMCFYKYQMDEKSDFEQVKLLNKKKQMNERPQRLYRNKLPISSAKDRTC